MLCWGIGDLNMLQLMLYAHVLSAGIQATNCAYVNTAYKLRILCVGVHGIDGDAVAAGAVCAFFASIHTAD